MRSVIAKLVRALGYELKKVNRVGCGSTLRPVGDMWSLIADLKFRGLDCKYIMDIGANEAKWSIKTKNIYPDAKFCLIEPQVEMEYLLKSFCNTTPGSVYFLAGAGAAAEKKYLTVWDDLQGSSFLPKEDNNLKTNGKQREIEMLTVNKMIADKQFGVPNLVKIDVQGFELEALKGAESIFGKTEAFIIEVSLFSFSDVPGVPVFADIVNFMLERDYVVYDFPGFLRRPLDGALGQCDVCFVQKNGFLRASNEW